ncbi:cell division protein FtsK [Pseudonocardia sp. WMMC193]|uniref:cell division protein FtsK n=1 Tax=Pseudonocardia sp. WMMC193 TaxID=2911965 RepID=UPI001F190E27|nr:cell division protein FtsK [Pseudonocardia sp. WMMC193]MCF7548920.1 cell division protein FtsK [Pseudonocardia sp. WMMC193]
MTATDPTTPARKTALEKLTAEREVAPLDLSQPIRPAVLRDKAAAKSAASNAVKRNAYIAGKFLLHLPVLCCLLVGYAPRGLARLVAALAKYLYDHDSAQVRHQHAEKTETAEYLRAQNIRRANLKARWLVASTVALVVLFPVLAWTFPRILAWVVGAATAVWIVKLIPGRGLAELAVAAIACAAVGFGLPYLLVYIPAPPLWAVIVVLAAAVVALGWVGRPRGKTLVKRADVAAAGLVEKLTAPYVIDALLRLGIGGMGEKQRDDIKLLMDVARVGAGYQVDLELPAGVEAAAVMEKRGKLSAALRRELGCVWPSVGARHEGHLSLFVSDQPMNRTAQKPWPLMKDGLVDVFQPVPFGTDQQGQWVTITMAYANGVIGAVPRMGKTFGLRQILLTAGLDPRAKVYAVDNKGTGDLAPCGLYAHFYGVGEEEEDVEAQLAAMREVREEMRKRARIIRGLPREKCPESKVTSVLANRRDLCPIVIGVDETQVWFEHEDKAVREEFTRIMTDLVKRGPALGIIVFLATQNVNANTIPTAISNNAVIRFCLKVFGWQAGDQILGTGAYKSGLDAQMFAAEDKGIGYLRADGTVTRIVRTVFGLDAVAAEKVAERARAARVERDLLTGMAAGEEPEPDEPTADLLADCRDVLDHPAVKAMHLAALRERLELLRPGIWGHLDTEALGSMLRAAGVRVGQVKAEGRNTSGVRREWLDEGADTVGEAG